MDSDRSLVLPQAFLDRMKDMLQDDYDAFLQAYDQPRTYGLRVNTAKISCEDFDFQRLFLQGRCPPFPLSPLPGRTLLPSGTKCHDPGFPHSSGTW